MSWTPEHPGGRITCDEPGCTRTRRNYCAPAERDAWVNFQQGTAVLDLCPNHATRTDLETKIRSL